MQVRKVGVLVDMVTNYGREVLRGILRYRLVAERWRLTTPLFANLQPIDWPDWDVDGYVAQVTTPSELERIQRRGLPTVNVSGRLAEIPLPTIRPDDERVGLLAAQHLLSCGFRNFVYLGWRGTPFSQARGKGFASEIELAGYRCLTHEIDPRTPSAELSEWLQRLPKPTGLFAYNDGYASEILRICWESGIAVPEQLAVIGVDDDEMFRDLGRPSLSSISLQAEQVGYEAAALLDQLLDGNAASLSRNLVVPGPVRARQSTDILAIDDPDVVRAVRYIREHAYSPICVDDVLNAVLVGRRSLERRFQDAMGRTLLEEIIRIRIERVRQLLVETDLPMPEVAQRSGFTEGTYMATTFRKVFDLAPREYRKKFGQMTSGARSHTYLK